MDENWGHLDSTPRLAVRQIRVARGPIGPIGHAPELLQQQLPAAAARRCQGQGAVEAHEVGLAEHGGHLPRKIWGVP